MKSKVFAEGLGSNSSGVGGRRLHARALSMFYSSGLVHQTKYNVETTGFQNRADLSETAGGTASFVVLIRWTYESPATARRTRAASFFR